MAWHECHVNFNYICQSSDTKLPGRPGETLLEANTGMQYIWDGVDWVEDLRAAVANETSD